MIKAIAAAREHGDLSENAEYHAARERQGFIEGRVMELEDKLSRAEVIDINTLSGSKIMFGARVKLVDEDTDEEASYQVVGPDEADIQSGLLSIQSPLAQAILGKEAGESVEVTTPRGVRCSRSSRSATTETHAAEATGGGAPVVPCRGLPWRDAGDRPP